MLSPARRTFWPVCWFCAQAHGPWRQRQQERSDRLVAVAHADVLRHVAQQPTDCVLALIGRQLADEDLQQRALADPVRPDKPHVLTR